MTECQELEPLFAPYVDGEVPEAACRSVDAHLGRCRTCRGRVASERAARAVLLARRGRLRPAAPGALRARCAAHTRGPARPWLPLSLAATLLLAVAGAVALGLSDNVHAVAAQLALDHTRCFQFAPERIATGDAAAAEQAWGARYGWALHVPRGSDARQLELLGVRRCASASGTMAHLLYRWQGQPLSVFVYPRSLGRRADEDRMVNTVGHEAAVWAAADRTYVALVRGRPADLPGLVGYLKAGIRER